MKVRSLAVASTLVIAMVAVACGGSGRRSGFDADADPTRSKEGDGNQSFTETEPGTGKGADCAINNAGGDPDKDYDGDGYPLKHDCNECDPNINPGAYDVPGNGIDEDCNGVADDEEIDCDGNIAVGTSDAFDGARALGLCKKASAGGNEWGVIEASWVKPDSQPLPTTSVAKLGYGVVPDFGVNAPQSGASMLALSSGYARAPGQAGYQIGVSHTKAGVFGYTSGAPAGYPKGSPACGNAGVSGPAIDGVGLLLKIRVPSNAQSFSYQQFFFTHEYPEFICDDYNDFFVAMLNPIPQGLPDGNIAFDQDGNPISVNNSFLQACTAGRHGGKDFDCPLGATLLEGTGFDEASRLQDSSAASFGFVRGHGGGTGWLTTVAPVKPGSEITLLFTIWDQEDGALDSTVLIDDFQWSVEGADGAVTKPSGPK